MIRKVGDGKVILAPTVEEFVSVFGAMEVTLGDIVIGISDDGTRMMFISGGVKLSLETSSVSIVKDVGMTTINADRCSMSCHFGD